MKKKIKVFIAGVLSALFMLTLTACTNSKEKAAVGDYTLSDIEFSVTMGAIGDNQTTEILKGSNIDSYLSYSETFCDIEASELNKLYKAYADAKLTLKKSKKAELTYGNKTASFKWKINKGFYVNVDTLKLEKISDSGKVEQVTVANGYIAKSGEVWFTLTSKICTVKYIFKK